VPLAEKKQTALQHIEQIHQFYGEALGVRIARKHILWYLQNFSDNASTLWQQINKINTCQQQYQMLSGLLNRID
jgi:tRNA-dihydrouridine synthase B